MAGYMLADRPGIVQPPEEGWHDTGDIVRIDAEGFVTIVGRAKRFAKLGRRDGVARRCRADRERRPTRNGGTPSSRCRTPRRGERLVLVTEAPAIRRDTLIEAAQRERLPELAIPRDIVAAVQLPLLGSGKTDYPAVQRLAAEAGPTDRTEAVAG